MLREYTSKQVTVLACKIEEGGEVIKLSKEKGDKGRYEYKHKGSGASTTRLEFDASKLPAVGDFIIHESKTDVYHIPADLMAKKYNVKGMYIK